MYKKNVFNKVIDELFIKRKTYYLIVFPLN